MVHDQVRFETVFRVFDTDDDGCLTTDQILKLYQSIRTLIPVLGNDEVYAASNTFFSDELGNQEGLRCFYRWRMRWTIERTSWLREP